MQSLKLKQDEAWTKHIFEICKGVFCHGIEAGDFRINGTGPYFLLNSVH